MPISRGILSALRKLQGRLPQRQSHRLTHSVLSARRFSPPAAPTIRVAELRRATWEELAVEFAYSDAKGVATYRTVKPLGLFYMDRSTVLIAWCQLRQNFRVFRLDRMADLLVTEQSFRPHRVPMLRDAKAQIQAQVAEQIAAKSRDQPE